jgi:hypothetical protein
VAGAVFKTVEWEELSLAGSIPVRLRQPLSLLSRAVHLVPEVRPGALAYRPHVNLRGPERLDVGFARIRPSI